MVSTTFSLAELQTTCSNKQSTLWIYLHRCAKLGPRSLWVRQKDFKLEEQCRTLCDKVVRHRMDKVDINHSPIKSPKFREKPSPEVISCFSDMIDLLFEANPDLYSDIIYKLNVPLHDERAVCRAFCDFAEHLFSKSISWSLIASLLAFSGGLAIECTRNGRSILVRSVCDWATVFIVIRLKEWVKENGGWDGVLSCLKSSTQIECSEEISCSALKRYFTKTTKSNHRFLSGLFLITIFLLLLYIGVTTTTKIDKCYDIISESSSKEL